MKFVRALVCLGLAFVSLFTAFYGRYKISAEHVVKEAPEYKGIITLWQIDTFEGGRGSRRQFLLDVAVEFERKHKGVLVMVIDHTIESANQSLREGNRPDMISFGGGFVADGILELNPSLGFSSAFVGQKCYAYAWCRGGYALIANAEKASEIPNVLDALTVSQGEYTQPLIALMQEKVSAKEITTMSPMSAYVKFVEGKTPYLLGTQRDVNRLFVRQKAVVIKPLNEFCDLYQYVTVTALKEGRQYYAKRFAEYLMSDTVQNKLFKIGMLSVKNVPNHEVEGLRQMQSVLPKSTLSVFTSGEVLKQLQTTALDAINGNQEAQIKIKNILVLS